MEVKQEINIAKPLQTLSETQINFNFQHMQTTQPVTNSNKIDRHYTPQLKFTNFAAQPSIVTKYVTSKFLRHETSYFTRDEAKRDSAGKQKESEEEDVYEDEEEEETTSEEELESNVEGSKVLVIHPGSKYLRIGRASEAFPVVVPHLIARRMRNKRGYETQLYESKREIKVEQETEDIYSANNNEIKKENENEEIKETRLDEEDAKEAETCSNSAGSSIVTEEEDEDEEHFKQAIGEIKKELKERMKASKRRPVANAQSQVHSFNKSAHPETIADHNDPYRIDWTIADDDVEYYVGEKALRLPDSVDSFKLFYPIQHGEFNTRDYDSIKAIVGDLETIWTESIREKLGISRKNFRNYSVILVIPDVYNRLYVLEIITMLLRYMEFRRVFIAQESVCVSFGAGMSVACIVDIGAQTSTVTCVEDGMCIPDSRVCLHYGGDDITYFFIKLLRRSKFPYSEMDLNRVYDWLLAEEMKEKFCTLDEANLTIQLNEFYVRAPNKPTLKYQIKTYDDAIIAPMLLFYPHIINFNKKRTEFLQKFVSYTIDDITEGAITNNGVQPAFVMQKPKLSVATQAATQIRTSFPSPSPQPRDSPGSTTPLRIDNNTVPAPSPIPTSVLPTTQPASPSVSSNARIQNAPLVDSISTLPLDDAIIQSINTAATEERAKKFYSSILVVGGGGLIPGVNKMLEERLSSRQIQNADKLEVLTSSRDLDPRLLVWKGGSVMSKLEILNESWINSREWEELGVRCLREKAFFIW
ncbi:hypothetical protein RclHR1_11590005 [Rhizophagus clarus]|uniref:Chromatin remodeling complex subunit n=1 Tax=Rhizophagus clarus TaxID=94130 RepID=A0A2Z6QJT3_9GLOM|nr:hypothetical protein RclHR1_11590005 [Rhizophagus clarus]GES85941.1 chromatin remodeling complex subunit [Rhizophagus clarus]